MSSNFKDVGPRNGACDNFCWNPVSAVQKGWSTWKTGSYNSNDAYQNCLNCGKHRNYHKSGKRAP
jgi:hypothetical protein